MEQSLYSSSGKLDKKIDTTEAKLNEAIKPMLKQVQFQIIEI